MKLSPKQYDISDKLSEFDLWVTPSLGDIRDSSEFVSALSEIQNGLEIISEITDRYLSAQTCSASNIANKLSASIAELSKSEATKHINRVSSVLFMVTGKTDNNLKCQFPLYLKQKIGVDSLPNVAKNNIVNKPIPRVLKSNAIANIVAGLKGYPDKQKEFLSIYYSFIIADEAYAKQLWSIGSSYVRLQEIGAEKSLVSSLAIFKSRGSITAIQGHSPEQMLRAKLHDWGLIADIDYNTQDIAVGTILGETVNADIKRRKYDFILPYVSGSNDEKVFVQCQFYASDSGSVSHKNVDQTSSTRQATRMKYPRAHFIEYVDGAGYYSSLNGDLRRLLFMDDTHDFFQIRTAPIKLRRNLQEINFLTLLEIEHAILMIGCEIGSITNTLLEQGYSDFEISNCIEKSIKNKLIRREKDRLIIREERMPIIRRYLLLDYIAILGHPIQSDNLTGNLFIPGFSTYWGLPQNQLISNVLEKNPAMRNAWAEMEVAFDDIQWLIENQYVISR
jgi:hypothetical protein